MPLYVIDWWRSDGYYVADVAALETELTADDYDELRDAVHDLVYARTETDRFWLEWKPAVPSLT